MEMNLTGRTALVTGASTGIGNAIARALAAEGVTVAIAARRRHLLEALSQRIGQTAGVRAFVVPVDLLERDAPQRLADAATSALGRVDILVNCAGGGTRLSLVSSQDSWEDGMTLNFTRVRELTHALIPAMVGHRWGRVINISGKSEPDQLDAAFSAKAAIHAWSKMLSREVGRNGITVNCIAPGKILSEQILTKYTDEDRAGWATNSIPVGRLGEPEELADLVVYLASPRAAYLTGAVIPFDGGLRRYAF